MKLFDIYQEIEMIQRRHALLGLGAASALPYATWSQGALWPSKPINLVVAFVPGVPADTITRFLHSP